MRVSIQNTKKRRSGRDLNTYWKDGAKGFKGVAIAGFPNLFTLMGSNTGPAHTSVLVYTEAQMEYARQAIQACEQKRIKSVAATDAKQAEFNEELFKKMKRTTWGEQL